MDKRNLLGLSSVDRIKHQQFAERVVRNQRRLYGFIVSLIPNRSDADELFQQTCLTLWENWDRYDPEQDFVSWACGIAHNKIRNFHRKLENKTKQLEPATLELLAENLMERKSDSDDRLSALRDCLQSLPEHSRIVVESYYGGRDVRDIASRRNTTSNAIYKLLNRVRILLHECVVQKLAGGSTV